MSDIYIYKDISCNSEKVLIVREVRIDRKSLNHEIKSLFFLNNFLFHCGNKLPFIIVIGSYMQELL